MDNVYISHKRVTATPMNRIDYNTYRGWNLPEEEKGRVPDEGYLVEYLDGGESNHPDHKGYILWSPKEHFDNVYTKEPDGFIGRMEVEFTDLQDKVMKLEAFFGNELFNQLPLHEQALLRHQFSGMTLYLSMLQTRLINAKNKGA